MKKYQLRAATPTNGRLFMNSFRFPKLIIGLLLFAGHSFSAEQQGGRVGGSLDLVPPPPISTKTAPDYKEIKVTSLGPTPIAAEKQAISDAVRQAVGVYVDAQEIIENEEVIKDRILSVSAGFVKEYKVLTPPHLVDGGIYQVTILAQVGVNQVANALKEAKIISGEVAGKNIWAESTSRIMTADDAKVMLQEKLPDLLRSACVITFLDVQGKPTQNTNPVSKSENLESGNIDLIWFIGISIDNKVYKNQVLPIFLQCFKAITGSHPEPFLVQGKINTFPTDCNSIYGYTDRSADDTKYVKSFPDVSQTSFSQNVRLYESPILIESINSGGIIKGYRFNNPKFLITLKRRWDIKLTLDLLDSQNEVITTKIIDLLNLQPEFDPCFLVKPYYEGPGLFLSPILWSKYSWAYGLQLRNRYLVKFNVSIPLDEIQKCKKVFCNLVVPNVELAIVNPNF